MKIINAFFEQHSHKSGQCRVYVVVEVGAIEDAPARGFQLRFEHFGPEVKTGYEDPSALIMLDVLVRRAIPSAGWFHGRYVGPVLFDKKSHNHAGAIAAVAGFVLERDATALFGLADFLQEHIEGDKAVAPQQILELIRLLAAYSVENPTWIADCPANVTFRGSFAAEDLRPGSVEKEVSTTTVISPPPTDSAASADTPAVTD